MFEVKGNSTNVDSNVGIGGGAWRGDVVPL
jgi:hypothetical protein